MQGQDKTKTLYDKLKAAHVTKVEAEYNGGGDEGWIEDISLIGSDGDALEDAELLRACEDFIYEKLPGGWEVNEGSYGTVTMDVITRKASFDHYWYVQSTEHDPFEVDNG